MASALCSIFFHNYYGSHQSWLAYFKKNISFPVNLYYNITEDSIYNLDTAIADFRDNADSSNINNIFILQSPNKGKDIGGKLVLLDAYQKLGLQTEYGLFLHDKKSPYKANNETWADNLLKIAERSSAENALKLFNNKKDTGIVAANGTVGNEFDYAANSFRSNNKLLLPELQNQFGIHPTDFKYVNGTMFWSRMKPLEVFFEKNTPLKIRAMLEKGNVSDEYAGTYTHSWERLLCWIITGQHYTIKTI